MSLKTHMSKRAIAGLLALCCAGAMCFATSPAGAAKVHVYSFSFGLFSNAQDVTVEQSTGDVYVMDAGAEAVEKFNAAGEPAEFTAKGGTPSAKGGTRSAKGSARSRYPEEIDNASPRGSSTQGDLKVRTSMQRDRGTTQRTQAKSNRRGK